MTTDLATVQARPPRSGVTRRLLGHPLAVLSLSILLGIVLISIFAPLLAPYPPNFVDLFLARQAPSAGHIMGGDGAGRDVFSRLLYGGRITLFGASITAIVAMAIGIPTGLLAGYYRVWFDSVANWFSDMLIAIPSMVILLAVIAAIGPNTVSIMAAFGVLVSPSFFRLVRTAVQKVRDELYVDAARISGLSDARIIRRHIFSVVRAPIVIQVAISSGIAVLMQTGIQFLGLGEQGIPSWGQMLADAFNNIYAAPYLVIWPGLAIGITVAALAQFGNALRDVLQDGRRTPRVRGPRHPKPLSGPVESTVGEDAFLSLSGLTIAYPNSGGQLSTVVEDVSFEIKRGEVLGLVGESGSGKTQTAFAILGLLPKQAVITHGRATLDGVSLFDMRHKHRAALRGRRIAYVPQEPMSNLDPSFRIGYQLVEPMVACLGITRREARSKALALLARVGIADPHRTFRAYPHEVSGGMAQRVLIAGAVSCDPELLIADEPTTALDVTVQAEVLDLLRDLQQERNMSMIMVSHNFGVVADICDRVVVMQGGRVVEMDDVRSIFSHPKHPYTRMLLDSTLENALTRTPLAAGEGRL